MTLTTRVAIVEPTPVRPVFDECRRLLGGEHVPFVHEPSQWQPGVVGYHNRAGQGLRALLAVTYGADAPLRPNSEDRRYDPPVDAWSIEVSFDTAYGYRAPNGAGCLDLHAWLVQQLGRWLDERGLTWYWCHEYDGTWHLGAGEIALLGDPERGRLPEPATA